MPPNKRKGPLAGGPKETVSCVLKPASVYRRHATNQAQSSAGGVKIIKHFNQQTPLSEASNDEELAEILSLRYPKACSSLKVDASAFSRMVEEVQKYKAWRVIGFESFEAFCEQELGKTLDEVNNIVHGVNNLRRQGHTGPTPLDQALKAAEQEPLPKHGTNQHTGGGDNITSTERGTSQTYLARRIKRDAPEVFEQLKAGGFKSVRQAAIAAGVLKVKPRLEVALQAFNKLSPLERAEFLKRVEGGGG